MSHALVSLFLVRFTWPQIPNGTHTKVVHKEVVFTQSLHRDILVKGCCDQTYFALMDLIAFGFFVLLVTSNLGSIFPPLYCFQGFQLKHL